jgi:hypothetical protein
MILMRLNCYFFAAAELLLKFLLMLLLFAMFMKLLGLCSRWTVELRPFLKEPLRA